MQEEVQKALKIHKANKDLKQKNDLLRREHDKAQLEYKTNLNNKELEIQEKSQHLEKLQDKLNEERQQRCDLDSQIAEKVEQAKNEQFKKSAES